MSKECEKETLYLSPITVPSSGIINCNLLCSVEFNYSPTDWKVTFKNDSELNRFYYEVSKKANTYDLKYNGDVYNLYEIEFYSKSIHKIKQKDGTDQSYDCEMCMYHKSQDNTKIVVLSVFLQQQWIYNISQVFFQQLIEPIFSGTLVDEQKSVDVSVDSNWSPYQGIPLKKSFYIYKGSSPHPTKQCKVNGTVVETTWILFETVVPILSTDYKHLIDSIFGSEKKQKHIGNNGTDYFKSQTVGTRPVYYNNGENVVGNMDGGKVYVKCTRLNRNVDGTSKDSSDEYGSESSNNGSGEGNSGGNNIKSKIKKFIYGPLSSSFKSPGVDALSIMLFSFIYVIICSILFFRIPKEGLGILGMSFLLVFPVFGMGLTVLSKLASFIFMVLFSYFLGRGVDYISSLSGGVGGNIKKGVAIGFCVLFAIISLSLLLNLIITFDYSNPMSLKSYSFGGFFNNIFTVQRNFYYLGQKYETVDNDGYFIYINEVYIMPNTVTATITLGIRTEYGGENGILLGSYINMKSKENRFIRQLALYYDKQMKNSDKDVTPRYAWTQAVKDASQTYSFNDAQKLIIQKFVDNPLTYDHLSEESKTNGLSELNFRGVYNRLPKIDSDP